MDEQDQLAEKENLQRIYRNRFDDTDRIRVDNFWDVFFAKVLNRYLPADGDVLDLAAGACQFINRVPARTRIAVDLNPDLAASAAPGVITVQCRSDAMDEVGSGSVDLVFSSNFFEHLATAEQLLATLGECHRVLRPGGRIIVLMPNLRAVGARYYDYLDHKLPVTDRSLVEALGLSGFEVTEVIPRLLPYGVNPAGRIRSPGATPGRSPLALLARPEVHKRALSAYLSFPPLWRVLGGQMLVVADRG